MEIIIVLIAIVVLGAIWYANRDTGFDANKDGKVDLKDAGVMLEQTVNTEGNPTYFVFRRSNVADTNNDGKVDAADAKVEVEKTKAAVKKAAVKAKTAVNKNRKPKAKA